MPNSPSKLPGRDNFITAVRSLLDEQASQHQLGDFVLSISGRELTLKRAEFTHRHKLPPKTPTARQIQAIATTLHGVVHTPAALHPKESVEKQSKAKTRDCKPNKARHVAVH